MDSYCIPTNNLFYTVKSKAVSDKILKMHSPIDPALFVIEALWCRNSLKFFKTQSAVYALTDVFSILKFVDCNTAARVVCSF